jgi:hypothetical protein
MGLMEYALLAAPGIQCELGCDVKGRWAASILGRAHGMMLHAGMEGQAPT